MSEVEIKKVEEQTAPVAATEEKPAVAEEKAPAAKKSSIINASVKPEDFDWDAFEGGEGNSPRTGKPSKRHTTRLSPRSWRTK